MFDYSRDTHKSSTTTALERIRCPNWERCSAPLCPLDETSLANGIWYPLSEEICSRKDFQTLDWIRNQKGIVKAGAPDNRFFNLSMLQATRQVRKGIQGVSPDQALEAARRAERQWIEEHQAKRVVAKKSRSPPRSIANRRNTLHCPA